MESLPFYDEQRILRPEDLYGYAAAFKQLKAEADSGKLTVKEQMEIAQKLSEYEDLRKVVDNIPEEILTEYGKQKTRNTEEKRL